jgi:hypothetical protein
MAALSAKPTLLTSAAKVGFPAQSVQARSEICASPPPNRQASPPNEKPPQAFASGVVRWRVAPPFAFAPARRQGNVSSSASEAAFALGFLTRQFPGTPDCFGLLAGTLDRGFLEMLLELHFPKHALALELFLQGPKGLIDVVVTNAYLHVVVTTFLS